MFWFVLTALAGNTEEGILPGAIPIRPEDVPPPVEAPAPPPPPKVDRGSVQVIDFHPTPAQPSAIPWVLGIGAAVFGTVLGLSVFASRLIRHEPEEDAAAPAPPAAAPSPGAEGKDAARTATPDGPAPSALPPSPPASSAQASSAAPDPHA